MTIIGTRRAVSGTITWIVFTLGLALAATYATLVTWEAARRLATGAPLDCSLFQQSPWDSAPGTVLAFLGGGLLLELLANGWRRNPLRRVLIEDRPSDRIDLFYVIINITGIGQILAIALSWGLVAFVGQFLEANNSRIAADLPPWVAVPIVYVVGDFFEYWGHRLVHTRFLWPLHAVHHAAEDMTVLSTFRHHPLDGFFGDLWYTLPAAAIGFSPEAMAITMLLVSGHVVLIHSRLPYPAWLEHFVCGPRAHRIHHGVDEDCHDRNFGILTIWDRMFGTFTMRDVTALKTGLADPFYGSGRPLRELFAVAYRCLSETGAAVRGLTSEFRYGPGMGM